MFKVQKSSIEHLVFSLSGFSLTHTGYCSGWRGYFPCVYWPPEVVWPNSLGNRIRGLIQLTDSNKCFNLLFYVAFDEGLGSRVERKVGPIEAAGETVGQVGFLDATVQ